jgi:beta-1,4-N-acetylglucosaminyltransferase
MLAVLGSGGHTAEMMSLLRNTNPARYKYRTYIVSSGDSFSANKAFEIEKRIQAKHKSPAQVTSEGHYDSITGVWEVKIVPRARKIHQSLYTAPISALYCLVGCFKALHETARKSKVSPRHFPDVIATNGPATAVIVIMAATILKFLGIAPLSSMKVIYVESWARVQSLSLSGKILLKLGICETFVVQWEALAKAINSQARKKKVEWCGFLVE